jgi:hypothetical protein
MTVLPAAHEDIEHVVLELRIDPTALQRVERSPPSFIESDGFAIDQRAARQVFTGAGYIRKTGGEAVPAP